MQAYIASQRHEGWQALTDFYDDGGYSGGTMERPALKRLLADIREGKIDTVVVYKVDRLTRSLHDFAKIVEVFDTNKVSFISVTQSFNTTSSMGRLTLNMLLSFAQFEREVTGERIRDKIAASKKKGMWMGGNPPLGYDCKDRQLVVNAPEAKTVRYIYQLYLELGSVRLLKARLDQEGVKSKIRRDRYGQPKGGKPLARGPLYHIHSSPLYRGLMPHKGKTYPGRHDPIIAEELWVSVQAKLRDNGTERRAAERVTSTSLLLGLLFDDSEEAMTSNHANKRGRRYRYYVSRSLTTDPRVAHPQGRRAPASDIERIIEQELCRFLKDRSALHDALASHISDMQDLQQIIAAAESLAEDFPARAANEKQEILKQLLIRITLKRESIDLHIHLHGLVEFCKIGLQLLDNLDAIHILSIKARLKRTGMEMRLLIEGAETKGQKPDDSLLRLLAQAQRFRQVFFEGGRIQEMAAKAEVTSSYFTRVLRLSFLAPDITKMILQGRQPPTLTARQLVMRSNLPADWREQRAWLGID